MFMCFNRIADPAAKELCSCFKKYNTVPDLLLRYHAIIVEAIQHSNSLAGCHDQLVLLHYELP